MRTGFRSISRVYVEDLDAATGCFVFDKHSQLIKRPSVKSGPFSFSGFNARSDVFQVFENDCTTLSLLSLRDNLLGYAVVHMANHSLFSAGDLAQALFSRLGTFALKALSMGQKLVSFGSKRSPSEQFACGKGGKDIFPKINSDLLARRGRGDVREIENKVKEPTFALLDKFRFFHDSLLQEFFVKRTDIELQTSSLLQSEKRKTLSFQRVSSLVKMDRTAFSKKNLLGFFQNAQRLRHFCNCIAGHLSAEFGKLFTYGVVGEMVEFYPIALLIFKSDLANIITSSRKLFLKLFKSLQLTFRKAKFDSNRSFHGKIYKLFLDFKQYSEERQFLLALKAGYPCRQLDEVMRRINHHTSSLCDRTQDNTQTHYERCF